MKEFFTIKFKHDSDNFKVSIDTDLKQQDRDGYFMYNYQQVAVKKLLQKVIDDIRDNNLEAMR